MYFVGSILTVSDPSDCKQQIPLVFISSSHNHSMEVLTWFWLGQSWMPFSDWLLHAYSGISCFDKRTWDQPNRLYSLDFKPIRTFHPNCVVEGWIEYWKRTMSSTQRMNRCSISSVPCSPCLVTLFPRARYEPVCDGCSWELRTPISNTRQMSDNQSLN